MANKRFKVMAQPCDECLFGKRRIVSAKRKAQILTECQMRDTHFECHKGTLAGMNICCRGFYDRYSTNLIRIAGRLNVIEFVDAPGAVKSETE